MQLDRVAIRWNRLRMSKACDKVSKTTWCKTFTFLFWWRGSTQSMARLQSSLCLLRCLCRRYLVHQRFTEVGSEVCPLDFLVRWYRLLLLGLAPVINLSSDTTTFRVSIIKKLEKLLNSSQLFSLEFVPVCIEWLSCLDWGVLSGKTSENQRS